MLFNKIRTTFTLALAFAATAIGYGYGATAPVIITCTQNRVTSYVDSNGNQQPAWFDNWKTSIPGYFLFEFTTSVRQDGCIVFNDSKITNNTTTPLLGINIGASGNTRLLANVNQSQGNIGFGNNVTNLAAIIPNTYSNAPNFPTQVITIKVELNLINKSLRLWAKNPTAPETGYALFFDSNANTSDATAFTNLLNQLPANRPAQYISFANANGNTGPVQFGNINFLPVAAIAPTTFSNWTSLTCPGYSVLEFRANVTDSTNGNVQVAFSSGNSLVPGKSLVLNLGLDSKETFAAMYVTPSVTNKYLFPTTGGRSFLKAGSFDYRIECNQSQAYLQVWRKAAGAAASTYQKIMNYPDWEKQSSNRSAFAAWSDTTNRYTYTSVAGTGATISNISNRSFLAQETTPPAQQRVDTGGDTIFPVFYEAWKLPADGRGIVEVTAKIIPSGNPTSPQLGSSVFACFAPDQATINGLNPYDNAFVFRMFNNRGGANSTQAFLDMRKGALPGTNGMNFSGGNLVFNPGTVLINNATPDTLGTVPVDLRFTINQPVGLFSVDIKANGAAASSYSNIFTYREGQPLSAPNATPGTAIPNAFASIPGILKYFSFSAHYSMSLWSNVRISAIDAVPPADFTLDEEFNGQELCMQTNATGDIAYAISEDNSMILTKKPFATGSWTQLATTGLSGSITSLAVNNDGEIYATLTSGATYKASTTTSPCAFTQVAGANKGALLAIASGKANNLLIIDDNNVLWRIIGLGVMATQDGPSGVLVSAVSQAPDGTAYLIDTANTAWKGAPAGNTFTWTQLPSTRTLPTPAGGSAPSPAPISFESICALSATSAMAITTREEIAVYNGTQWSLMPVSATNANPANGFARIAANAAGKIALTDYNGMLLTNLVATVQTPDNVETVSPEVGTPQQQADAYNAYLAAQNDTTAAALKTATGLTDITAAKAAGQAAAMPLALAAYTAAKTAADAATAALTAAPTDAAKQAANTAAQATLTTAQNSLIKVCGVTTITEALAKAGTAPVTAQQKADAYNAYLAAQNDTTTAALKTATGLTDITAAKAAGQAAAMPLALAAYTTAKTAADAATAALAAAPTDATKQAANTAAQAALTTAQNNLISVCGVTTIAEALAKAGTPQPPTTQQIAAAYKTYTAAKNAYNKAHSALNKTAKTKQDAKLKAADVAAKTKLDNAQNALKTVTGETDLAKAEAKGKTSTSTVAAGKAKQTPRKKLTPKKKPTPPRRRKARIVKKAAPKLPAKKK